MTASRSARRIVALSICSFLSLSAGLASTPASACPPDVDPQGKVEKDRTPQVRIALLLDTSNSMDGLIHQAKTQLWSIVNKFQKCDRAGKLPRLSIALYEYGNNNLSPGNGYVRQVLPFTTDLDLMSEKLFALSTNGGSEYCATVIQAAGRELEWTTCDEDLQMIVIAGNEPFTQGGIDYRLSIPEATRKNISVHTIFCGNRQEGISTNWQDGAVLGKGAYCAIEQDHVAPHVVTPYDDDIKKCNDELNQTYVPYGGDGRRYAERQAASDLAAEAAAPAAAMERAAAKATLNYQNSHWDLVDAVRDKKVDLAKLSKDELPENLRKLDNEELEVQVKEFTRKRADAQTRMQELHAKREAFLKQQSATQPAPTTLADALIEAIGEQAATRGYVFEK